MKDEGGGAGTYFVHLVSLSSIYSTDISYMLLL